MKDKIKELIPYVVILIVVMLIRTFIATPARVDGESMEPTLYNGEIVLLNKIYLKDHKLQRYDIVVFKYEDDYLIKRIIAFPGETIEYLNNELYINYRKVSTPYNFEYTDDFKYEVSENEYFVIGDNRDNSKDSRYFGPIKKEQISGKVTHILFPFKKIGKVK